MIPDFYVFSTNEACTLIKNIENNGFNAFVCEGINWLAERLTNPKKYRLIFNVDRWELLQDGIQHDCPFLCISLDEEVEDWTDIMTWVNRVIIDGGSSEITAEDLNFQRPITLRREYNPPGEEVIIDGVKSHVLSTPPADIDLKNGYNYCCFYDEALDIKYYEVISPSSETPFTVVVNNFSKKDDSWLFSDIYASNAWGRNNLESRYDFHFLTVLWKHLKLPGEFTMDVVKRRVDACYPDRVKDLNDLESEPTVYRRAMREVIGMKRKRVSEQEFIDTKDHPHKE